MLESTLFLFPAVPSSADSSLGLLASTPLDATAASALLSRVTTKLPAFSSLEVVAVDLNAIKASLTQPSALSVSSVTPSGSELRPTNAIVVAFSQAMVALSSPGDVLLAADPGTFITVTPAVDGKWRWVGPQIAQLDTTKPLAGATEYTVTVKQGTRSDVGGTLEAAFTHSFTTAAVQVTSNTHQCRTLRPYIWLTASPAPAAAYLSAPTNYITLAPAAGGANVALEAFVQGSAEFQEAQMITFGSRAIGEEITASSVVVRPKADLAKNSAYTWVAKDVPCAAGPRVGAPSSGSVQTYGSKRLRRWMRELAQLGS